MRCEILLFQSTSPARGTTRKPCCPFRFFQISIHVPRKRDDKSGGGERMRKDGFQSTSPARGTTTCPPSALLESQAFQSTSPARGTTIRPSSNGRLFCISIHVPRKRDDQTALKRRWKLQTFQSTSPARGTTLGQQKCTIGKTDFNPRPPQEGRLRNG